MFFDIGHLFAPCVSPWILRVVGGVCPTPCLFFPETPRVFPPHTYGVARSTEDRVHRFRTSAAGCGFVIVVNTRLIAVSPSVPLVMAMSTPVPVIILVFQ